MHNRLKRCRHGQMLFNVNDVHIGRALDLYGEWAESELELLGLFLAPGDVVIDVGANIGTHTVFFAQRVGPTGRVLAFEPQRVVFQTLCANAALNDLTNVHALHAALSSAPGTIRVPALSYDAPANYGGVALDAAETHRGEPVPVMTLDGLGIDRCKLIKLDVEGMELDVVNGAGGLIARAAPMLYLENNDVAKSPALIQRLEELGYRLFWHFSRFFNPANFAGNAENVFGKLGDVNMIAVRPELASAFADFQPVRGPGDTWDAVRRRLGYAG